MNPQPSAAALRCPHCQRSNPAAAIFCYFDGSALVQQASRGPVSMGSWTFPMPLIWPDGRSARSFNQLVELCQHDWETARDLLRRGQLEQFLGGLGRLDLAQLAHRLAADTDADRALDHLLSQLPADNLQEPRLQVEPTLINLGQMRPGQDRTLVLAVRNRGMRLLTGSIAVNCPWLALGEPPLPGPIVFQTHDQTQIKLHVVGKALRASPRACEEQVRLESNGGNAWIKIKAQVPVLPFPESVLQGAVSPRQLAEKARQHPQQAAELFENGAVQRWYESNGWSYPVLGPAGSGLGAVQQFFEALGLVKAPPVTISDREVRWHAQPGQRVSKVLVVRGPENKPVFATGSSDQAWLRIHKPQFKGNIVLLPLEVPTVPTQPGQTLTAQVRVRSNGNQQFVVPVTLEVAALPANIPVGLPVGKTTHAHPTTAPVAQALPVSDRSTGPAAVAIPVSPARAAPAAVALPVSASNSIPATRTGPTPTAPAASVPGAWEAVRRIYWCGILGGWSAFVGWLLMEMLLGASVGSNVWLALLMVMVVAMAIGGGQTVAGELANRHWRQLVRCGPGLAGGLLGGLVGGLLGNLVYYLLGQQVVLLGFLARVLGWICLGVCVGAAEGIYERSWRKTRNGLLGGGIGGFLGGLLFNPLTYVAGSPVSGRALAFVLLGLFIGLSIGLVQFLLKEAWLTVAAGFRPGRQLILTQASTTLGTSEKASLIFIAYGARGVEPIHVRIRQLETGRYVLEDNQTRAGTLLNGEPVQAPTPLQDGDIIQFGVNQVCFHERYRPVGLAPAPVSAAATVSSTR